ncbi:3-bisphosphoglycerate-independent phosphoglycerate mutase [Striga asiatica]|uniref:3-bisphosphoglycerate-independent phosphoglycerate mutase n=1 Tax=Striga asiatica TaxID=4170 RepID=A0A5A7PFA6_STRAF|nr:3-bisphosphoglycerate-independent phosphoglycerate mutase [Striga asiatica]
MPGLDPSEVRRSSIVKGKESRNMVNLPRHVVSRTSTVITSFLRRNPVPCFGVPFAGLCCFMYSMDFDGRWERRNSEATKDIKESSEELSYLRKRRTELEAGIERLEEEIMKGGETGRVRKGSGRHEAWGWFG